MQNTSESRNLSISINRDAAEAYELLSVPENFPRWASGLGALRKADGNWIAETPGGPVKVSFSERNAFGILDHWVFPTPETVIYIPMRVVRNGNWCELIVTLFRLSGMTREQFDADAEWVLRDLRSAKQFLEGDDA